MIWLLTAIGLRWAGVPWFAVLVLAVLAFSLAAAMDPLLIMLEFSRLREFKELLALPILLYCALLLGHAQAPAAGLGTCAGDWLLPESGEGRGAASAGTALPGLLFAPSVGLVLVWMIMQALSPNRTPELQQVFLAGLLPALLASLLIPATALWRDPETRRRAFRFRLEWLLIPVLLAGLYLGRWGLLEAAALAAVLLTARALMGRTRQAAEIRYLLLESLRDFGMLALLLGLGLAWAAAVFDAGLSRGWLAGLLPVAPGSYAGNLMTGLWLSVAWAAGAWLLRPLPALIIGAPFLIPAALIAGLAPEQLALVSVLSLYAGHALGQEAPELHWLNVAAPMLLAALLLLIPGFSLWLPGLLAGHA